MNLLCFIRWYKLRALGFDSNRAFKFCWFNGFSPRMAENTDDESLLARIQQLEHGMCILFPVHVNLTLLQWVVLGLVRTLD